MQNGLIKMKELQKIISAHQKLSEKNQRTAIATVVNALGSSYRKAGARMLIAEDGFWTGSISGGCLEGDALNKSREVIRSQKSKLVQYDTRHGIENALGDGFGCDGVLTVLVEPIVDDSKNDPVSFLKEIERENEACAMATIYDSNGLHDFNGQRILLKYDDSLISTISDQPVANLVLKNLRKHLLNKDSGSETYNLEGNTIKVLFETFKPDLNLVIYGAVFHALPITRLAKDLGWKVTITDVAKSMPDSFFYEADNLLYDKMPTLDYPDNTAAVCLTHNPQYLMDVLKYLMSLDINYIGILGSKKRINKIFRELAQDGFPLSEKDHERIHNPIGLDLGNDTPEEIALSIVAEIQQKFSKKGGGYMKDLFEPIHKRILA
ncbi:MAG: XdhC family protein [Candidatus Cyclobacteriaceae bacterium M3_2C_046]